MRVPLPSVDDPRLIWRRLRVDASHVAFVRGLLEASEGLASMFAERGGDLLLVSTVGQEEHLDQFITDICEELQAVVVAKGNAGQPFHPVGDEAATGGAK